MELEASRRIIGVARRCAYVVQSNAHYIEKELPNVPLDDATREETKGLCAKMFSLYFDILDVVEELEEKFSSDDFHFKSFKTHSRLVSCWMWELIKHMDLIISRVSQMAEHDPECRITYILLSESAVNLMNAFGEMDDAIGQE